MPLDFEKTPVVIKRGTFTGNICINPGKTDSGVPNQFEYEVGFEISKPGFDIFNTRITS